jgi:hypothetical protein
MGRKKINRTNGQMNRDMLSFIQSFNCIFTLLGAFAKTKGNRESGANPERSRHCNRGVVSCLMSLEAEPSGKTGKTQRSGSQETYLINHTNSPSRKGTVYAAEHGESGSFLPSILLRTHANPQGLAFLHLPQTSRRCLLSRMTDGE